MTQRRPARLETDNTALLKHTGGQFESRAAITNIESVTERDADLRRNPTSQSHDSPYISDLTGRANSESEGMIVDRQPTATERISSSQIVHHNGHTVSSNVGLQVGKTPILRWHSETAKAQPWNGLGQVFMSSKATTEIPQTGTRSKTYEDSASRGSFNDDGRQK